MHSACKPLIATCPLILSGGVSPGQLAVSCGHLRYCTPASPLAARLSDLAHTSIMDLLQTKFSDDQHCGSKRYASLKHGSDLLQFAPAKATGSQVAHPLQSLPTKLIKRSINMAPSLPHISPTLSQKLSKCSTTCMSAAPRAAQPAVMDKCARKQAFWIPSCKPERSGASPLGGLRGRRARGGAGRLRRARLPGEGEVEAVPGRARGVPQGRVARVRHHRRLLQPAWSQHTVSSLGSSAAV